jgi:hypothetical protein
MDLLVKGSVYVLGSWVGVFGSFSCGELFSELNQLICISNVLIDYHPDNIRIKLYMSIAIVITSDKYYKNIALHY